MLTLLRNADVYAPEPRGRMDLMLGGGQILAMGPSLPALPGALGTEVDLAGARIIPGLIDAHVHVTGGGGEAGPASRVPRVALSAMLSGGVTTCVGVLGTDGTTRSVADLVATTLGLRAEGMSAYCWTGNYQVPPITLTGSVRSDIVFVDPIIGLGEIAISDHRSSQPTHDELARLAADCHVAGLMSGKAGVLHLHLGDGPRGVEPILALLRGTELPPRVFHPTHVNRKKALFDASLELARVGCCIDVTAFPVEDGEDAFDAATAIERYWAADAPAPHLTCSSDGGGCLPTFDAQGNMLGMDIGAPAALAHTLKQLLDRGHDLARVAPVFTSNVAKLLRLPHKGVLAPGASADIVVLGAQGQIESVVAQGRFVVRGQQVLVHGTFEPKA
jgi:beta-aspartyl-dipeptidase (metallo-type)